MDQRKRLDKILDGIEKKIQDEVATLLGCDFSLFSGDRELLSKEEIFFRLQGKQICAQLEITGEHASQGCLLIGIKDAIRLGGTLVMLPDLELQEVIGREEYREELADSYGEIANIVAGSITKAFEEMYPKPCRFIRKEQEVLIPAKVEIESEKPVANQRYYQCLFSMLLDGKQLGDMVLLMPALAFLLEEAPQPAAPEVGSEKIQPSPPQAKAEPAVEQASQDSVVSGGEAPRPAERPTVDFDKQKKRIDKLLAECQKRLASEVGALLSTEIALEKIDSVLVDKGQFFSEMAIGKQILAQMEVAGESDQNCYFAIGIKDAIQLGGILIMLPPSELTSVINEEDFGDDTQDAYGEVANIVSGVYTAVFEEQHSPKLRFVKKALSKVVPAKVVKESNDPIADVTYYCQTMQLVVAGKPLGQMHMLFPAEILQLEGEAASVAQPDAAKESAPPASRPAPMEAAAEDKAVASAPPTVKVESPSRIGAEKHKRLVDKLLVTCRDQVASEVSALLGTEVTLSDHCTTVINKETFFFEEVSGKQVVTHFEVAGESEGKSHLVIGLRDAIRFGGTLIMLPNQELESVVAEETFSDDTSDAYGEIANIIAGVYTAVFEEQYVKRIRFIKKELEQVVPMKVDIASESPFPDGSYYLSSAQLGIGDEIYGKINLVFPLELLGLEGLLSQDEAPVAASAAPVPPAPISVARTSPDILLVGDDEVESVKIAGVLEGMGHVVKRLSFKDNVHNYLPGELRAIYLVMQNVNEQAFGAAIKISAACNLPLIAAGPGWTRSKVIKAVRYGIRDILLTPASAHDIEENLSNNLLKLAA